MVKHVWLQTVKETILTVMFSNMCKVGQKKLKIQQKSIYMNNAEIGTIRL